jgi:hypothetical protein
MSAGKSVSSSVRFCLRCEPEQARVSLVTTRSQSVKAVAVTKYEGPSCHVCLPLTYHRSAVCGSKRAIAIAPRHARRYPGSSVCVSAEVALINVESACNIRSRCSVGVGNCLGPLGPGQCATPAGRVWVTARHGERQSTEERIHSKHAEQVHVPGASPVGQLQQPGRCWTST